MSQFRARALSIALLGLLVATAAAQEPPAGLPREELTAWEWYADVQPFEAKSGLVDLVLPPAVLDKARLDLADLRIRDAKNRELPFALRIRRNEQEVITLKFEEFNHSRLPDRSDELSLDLGAGPVQHNEMFVSASGVNFRRRLLLEGSDDRNTWKIIEGNGQLARYEADGRTLDVRHLRYATSRFRYLRVRVYPDPLIPNDMPTIGSVTMNQSRTVPGEYVTLPATLSERRGVRTNQGYGTAWTIDLGAEVPIDRLVFTVDDNDFVRDYQLEVQRDVGREDMKSGPSPNMYAKEPMREDWNAPYYAMTGVVASGQWRRRAGVDQEPLEVRFGTEVRARKLKLVVTDNRNPPLNLRGVQYTAAARQIIFERPGDGALPLRLYLGNPSAMPPNYDFARNLPRTLPEEPQRVQLAPSVQANPEYRPTPKPWTERYPWVIYVVLAIASAALLCILAVLARQTIQRHDAEMGANPG